MTTLTIIPSGRANPGARDENTGEALLNDIYDLIVQRLPRLPLTDPARPALAALSPQLGRALGRRLTLVGGEGV